ncbi:unnamed protein product [Allacma fusca]|uniref:Uncharacterized protein n=1 Tax=Allacma fusca TaxID=39272 RepID=A0A8J2KP94_9HEXA|nr:unnamed protein product [Allacma fusca]
MTYLESKKSFKSCVAFEDVDQMLDFFRKRNIKPSTLKTVICHLNELKKSQEMVVKKCEEHDRRIEHLKKLYFRDSSRYEQIHAKRDQVGMELLNRKKDRENLVKSFIELKENYEEMVAKQYSNYIIEGQVQFQQRTSQSSNEEDPVSKGLRDKIREIDDEIASLEQELSRKNHSIVDLKEKLDQVQKSVQKSQPAGTTSTRALSDGDNDPKFGFQLLP